MACSRTVLSASQPRPDSGAHQPGAKLLQLGFVQLQRRMTRGLSLQFSYTFAKSMMLDGMDFNNQFDFSNTHAPSLLDQRHRLTFAGGLPAAVWNN